MISGWAYAHSSRLWWHLVVQLRIVLGFAFVPSGLKKIIGEPFTDPTNLGIFHEFLHAFHSTGLLYRFVGVVQLVAALLLMTQFFGALGAMIFLPVCCGILVLCWGTGAIPTAIVVTAMTLAALFLLLWDFPLWAGLLRLRPETASTEPAVGIRLGVWSACGAAIFLAYAGSCLWAGEIYRPRGMDWTSPGFYILPMLLSFLGAAFLVERRQVPNY
jgi:hypothetical protein